MFFAFLFDAFVCKLALEEQHVFQLDALLADHSCAVLVERDNVRLEGQTFGFLLDLLFSLSFGSLSCHRFHPQASLIDV